MPCVDDNTVVELMARRLAPERRAEVHAHLDACEACRALVAGAAGELASCDTTAPASSRTPAEPLVLPPGAMVDHYRVMRLLGHGGMGEVYLALDTLLERKVALKMVRPELRGRDEAIERFLAEARATARLSHRSIVTIHAVGTHEGRPYLALELLTGETLRARLERGPLDWREAASIALAVARALAAAHAAGVCHRDLKPSNVMLCLDERICVLDFGLAKVVDALEITWVDGDDPPDLVLDGLDRTSTRTGGTPPYMAPEQWRGQATTTAADVWALGVLLFEACAGRRPFQASRAQPRQRRLAELAQQVAACEPAPSLAAAAPVPAAFAALVERCLEKDAGARPAAPEVVEALAALVAPQPAAPQPSTAPPPAPAPARARTWAIGALAALSLSAGGAGALVILRADSEARVHSTPAAQPARERLTATPRLEGDSAAEPPVTPQPSGAPAPSDAKGARPAPAPAPSQAKSAAPWDPLSYR